MKICVTLRRIIIRDTAGGEAYEVSTLRTAEEISAFLEETEREFVEDELAKAVGEAYRQRTKKTGND
jgi:hypothetical protein